VHLLDRAIHHEVQAEGVADRAFVADSGHRDQPIQPIVITDSGGS